MERLIYANLKQDISVIAEIVLKLLQLHFELIGCLTLRWRKRVYTWKGKFCEKDHINGKNIVCLLMQCHSHVSFFMKNVSVVIILL